MFQINVVVALGKIASRYPQNWHYWLQALGVFDASVFTVLSPQTRVNRIWCNLGLVKEPLLHPSFSQYRNQWTMLLEFTIDKTPKSSNFPALSAAYQPKLNNIGQFKNTWLNLSTQLWVLWYYRHPSKLFSIDEPYLLIPHTTVDAKFRDYLFQSSFWCLLPHKLLLRSKISWHYSLHIPLPDKNSAYESTNASYAVVYSIALTSSMELWCCPGVFKDCKCGPTLCWLASSISSFEQHLAHGNANLSPLTPTSAMTLLSSFSPWSQLNPLHLHRLILLQNKTLHLVKRLVFIIIDNNLIMSTRSFGIF